MKSKQHQTELRKVSKDWKSHVWHFANYEVSASWVEVRGVSPEAYDEKFTSKMKWKIENTLNV